MECTHCKSTWNSAVRMSTCPFCGKDISCNEIEVNNVSDALRKIIQEKTLDILNSPKVVISLVSDYVVGFQREKKLLRIACSNGALKYIITIANEENVKQKQLHIQKLNKVLIDDAFLSDENATIILDILLAAIESPAKNISKPEESRTVQKQGNKLVVNASAKSNVLEDEPFFEELLERSVQDVAMIGKTVTGMLMDLETGEVWLDGDDCTFGYLTTQEIADRNLGIADNVKAVVVGTNGDGTLKLSCDRLDRLNVWDEIEELKDKKEILEGTVVETNQGGLSVSVMGIRVFVPASQSGVSKGTDLTQLIGNKVELIITDVNLDRRRAIGSVSAAQKIKQQNIWDNIKEGAKFSSTVKLLADYGAFVDIGGVDGFVSKYSMGSNEINHPSDVLSVGDKIEVYVISFDKEKNRISLGYKTEEKKQDNLSDAVSVAEKEYDEIPPYKETIRRIYHGEGKVKSVDEYAVVKFRFEPCECTGLCFENHITDNSIPKLYIPAIEKGLQDAFKTGPLSGSIVDGIKAVLIGGAYHLVSSSVRAFEKAARLAFEESYKNGAPVLLEEFIEERVIVSDDHLSYLFSKVNSVRGRVIGLDPAEKSKCSQAIFEIPISGKAQIENSLEMDAETEIVSIRFVRYEQVTGPVAEKIIDELKNK